MLEATGKKFGIANTVTNLDLIITIVITCLQSRNRSHVLHIFAICECSSRTPAYHISGSGGQDFVFAISGDENDEVKHSISSVHDTRIQKRQQRSRHGYLSATGG